MDTVPKMMVKVKGISFQTWLIWVAMSNFRAGGMYLEPSKLHIPWDTGIQALQLLIESNLLHQADGKMKF